MTSLFRMLDQKQRQKFAIPVREADALTWNERGFGIFHTVNEFQGSRKKENLCRIFAWAVDMDAGTKDEQLRRIAAGLVPSRIIETKRGFQPYFNAKDASVERHPILMQRLVAFYGADPRAKDLSRLLRTPGYFHMKEPTDPFLIRQIWEWTVSYTEAQMLLFYPPSPAELAEQEKDHNRERRILHKIGGLPKSQASIQFWGDLWNMNQEYALARLSGHPAVNGEVYTFKRNASGTKNIFVNGQSTSTWIDTAGRIGSFDKGGPTVFQWLKWFGHSSKTTISILKEVLWNRN